MKRTNVDLSVFFLCTSVKWDFKLRIFGRKRIFHDLSVSTVVIFRHLTKSGIIGTGSIWWLMQRLTHFCPSLSPLSTVSLSVSLPRSPALGFFFSFFLFFWFCIAPRSQSLVALWSAATWSRRPCAWAVHVEFTGTPRKASPPFSPLPPPALCVSLGLLQADENVTTSCCSSPLSS